MEVMDRTLNQPNNFDHEIRLCGASWVYCNGKCNNCQRQFITTTSTTDTNLNNSQYTNHT